MTGVDLPLDGNNTAELINCSHIGIVAKNAVTTAERFTSVGNTGKPDLLEYWPGKEEIFHGEPFGVRVVWVKLGPLTVEILEPLDDSSVWSRFLVERGEGLHHIAFDVTNYDATVANMISQGCALLVHAVFRGRRWCYFDTPVGNAIIELLEPRALSVASKDPVVEMRDHRVM